MDRFIVWLRYIFAAARPAILLVALLVICYFGFALFGRKPEANIRWTGMTLQIVGFLLAIVDLESTRRIMGGPSFVTAWKAFFENLPKRRTAYMSASVSAATFVGTADAKVLHNPAAPIADRLARLETDVEQLETHLSDLRKSTKSRTDDLDAAIKSGVETVQGDLSDLAEKVRSALTGGYYMQWVGVAYFVTGVVLASTSIEASCQWFGQCPP